MKEGDRRSDFLIQNFQGTAFIDAFIFRDNPDGEVGTKNKLEK